MNHYSPYSSDYSISPTIYDRRIINRHPRSTSVTPTRSSSSSSSSQTSSDEYVKSWENEVARRRFQRWLIAENERDAEIARLAGRRRNKKTKSKPNGRKIKQRKSKRLH